MALVDIRQRTGYLSLTLIVGHVILISTQVTTNRGVPLFEAIVFGAFSEVQRASNAMADDVRLWWQDYFALQQVRADNTKMKEELAELRIRLQQERGAAEQSRTLQHLLNLKTSITLSTTAAMSRGGAVPVQDDHDRPGTTLAARLGVIAPQSRGGSPAYWRASKFSF